MREMIERAAATTPEDMISLHGQMKPSAEPLRRPADPGRPGRRRAGPPEPRASRRSSSTASRFRKGAKVVLRPGTERDVYDRMLDGRTATIERLYIDYEDGAHVAVTIDDDPAQELFRETGRYLFFKAGELEAVSECPGEHDSRRSWSPGSATPGCGDDGFGGHVAKRARGARAAGRASPCSTSAPAGSTSPTR